MAAQIMAEVTQTKRREISTKTRYDMHWEMNRRCNFNCDYCFRKFPDEDRRTEDPACARYSPEHIAHRFDEIGKPVGLATLIHWASMRNSQSLPLKRAAQAWRLVPILAVITYSKG